MDNGYKDIMDNDGYVILKNALPQKMVDSYNTMIGNYFGLGKARGESRWKPDAFNNAALFELHKLFELKDFTEPLQSLTDNKLMYLHHGDIHLNFTAINLHDDCQERGTDTSNYSWQEDHPLNREPYRCYTIAMYLQDHDDDTGLSVMKGSHKLSYTGMTRENMHKLEIPITNLNTKMGDVVIFDCRLLHKGNKDGRGDRKAIYFRMGQKNIHSENHIIGAVTRQQQENNQPINAYKIHPEFQAVLEKNSILY